MTHIYHITHVSHTIYICYTCSPHIHYTHTHTNHAPHTTHISKHIHTTLIHIPHKLGHDSYRYILVIPAPRKARLQNKCQARPGYIVRPGLRRRRKRRKRGSLWEGKRTRAEPRKEGFEKGFGETGKGEMGSKVGRRALVQKGGGHGGV